MQTDRAWDGKKVGENYTYNNTHTKWEIRDDTKEIKDVSRRFKMYQGVGYKEEKEIKGGRMEGNSIQVNKEKKEEGCI